MAARGITFCPQVDLPIFYKGRLLKKCYCADFVCYEKIIVEIKAVTELSGTEEAQLLNYLKATGMRVGLLINFGEHGKLDWQRFVL